MKSDIYNVDISIEVSVLASSSGKIFLLKLYDKTLHNKIHFVF